MGVITPAPGVLGAVSLTAAVQLVCLANLILCIYVISVVDSSKPTDFASVAVSPTAQCWNAAWFLLGIPMVIYGGVGAMYRVEFHMRVYEVYLVGTFFIGVAWTYVLLRYSSGCSTIMAPHTFGQAQFACTINNGITIFLLFIFDFLVLFAIYLVWSMKEFIQKRFETELIRYQEPWEMVASLADDVAQEEAKKIQAANQIKQAEMGWGAVPAPLSSYAVQQQTPYPVQQRVAYR